MIDPEAVLEQLREKLKKRGAEGIRGLARNFKICDTDGSQQLNEEELGKCFRLCKLDLKSNEIASLFAWFDNGGNGTVSFDEFVKGVRGKMNKPRRTLVVKIFRALDAAGDNSGTLTAEDIAPAYDAANHPDVLDGTRTEKQVLQEFLDGFEGKTEDGDGTVTIEEFLEYYEDVSASIDEDDMFGAQLMGTWSALKTRGPNGEEVPAVVYVSESDVNMLERVLKKNIYQKATVLNETATLKKAFKLFDADGSGEVSFREFAQALERFGLFVLRPGDRGKGGVMPEVLRALFDRYNADQSPCISYEEFSVGLYGLRLISEFGSADHDVVDNREAEQNEQGGQNPWLPSLAHRESMDPYWSRPMTHSKGDRSIANGGMDRPNSRSIANGGMNRPNRFTLN